MKKKYKDLTESEKEEIKITVCDHCNTAACWWAIFMCQKSENANIKDVPIYYLEQLGAEHPDYWKHDIKTHFINENFKKKIKRKAYLESGKANETRKTA